MIPYLFFLGECGWNGGWVKDCFGTTILQQISQKSIICSGVSIGTTEIIFEYLTLMNDIIMNKKKTELSKLSLFPICERNGVDQGVHNVLVHKNMIKNLVIVSQKESPVINLQAKKARINGMKVLNEIGELAAIVHQYDRYPDLQRLLFQKVSWCTFIRQ